MDRRLHRLLAQRLDADEHLSVEPGLLVLAACEGSQSLSDALGGAWGAKAGPEVVPAAIDPPAAYLRGITVEGFRGIGPEARLDLEPGPGLTLVVGRNGTGKSSFAEGLEICLTGENRRWRDRTAVWRDGWRNVHRGDPCRVSAAFCVDGVPGALTAVRAWGAADGLAEGSTTLSGHPHATTLDELGWGPALASLRPFLSYNELGSMFQGRPSDFYDALAAILGLDDLVAVSALLKNERSAREKAMKAARDRVPALIARLDGIEDERAAACRAGLSAKPWDLDAIELALGGMVDGGDPEGELATLRALAQIERPQVEVTPDALRAAADDLDRVAGTDAGAAMRVADLLRRSLEHQHETGDGPCPVCATGRLDATWRAGAEAEMERLRAVARSAMAAHEVVTRAVAAAGRAMDPEPATLAASEGVGIDAAAARVAWATWRAGHATTDAREMARHIEEHGASLDAALGAVRLVAAEETERREDAWRPAARDLREWLAVALPAVAGAAGIAALKRAETWVKEATDGVRTERFAPISAAASAHWAVLRQGSSVEVTGIGLAGSATQRRVQIDVQIDGAEGAALGMMSQGELCSLALCMFLPRATLDESPFRFVVIDDPVQSMDPSKVDGLARVLESVAASRQVIVFTHDDRLPEAVRRLRVDARVIEVRRAENSVVALTPGLDPVEARLNDARAAAKDDKLPPHVAARVVPGLCRQAIEAGCAETVRRRRLGRGDGHEKVEELLAGVTGLYEWVALALFDDGGKESQGKVLSRLNNDPTLGRQTADAFKECNAGAHGAASSSLQDLVRDSGRLARGLAGRG